MLRNIKWYLKQKYQKVTRGFSDEELWNLDYHFCKWLVPRLKAFKEKTQGYPPNLKTPEEWEEILQKMIDGFEIYTSDFENIEDVKKNTKKTNSALSLFKKYFSYLWW